MNRIQNKTKSSSEMYRTIAQIRNLKSLFSNPKVPPSQISLSHSSTILNNKINDSEKTEDDDNNDNKVSLLNRDPYSPPKLLVVQPRIRPDSVLKLKLGEALNLANSLEERRDGCTYADMSCKDKPPHIIVQNPAVRSDKLKSALYGNTFGDSSSLGSSSLWKNVLNSRRMSTSLSSPESSGVATPSERKVGLYQDLVIPVTNFHNEDKGLMVLAGDVFDVPIRKDIVHRTVLWQLAKRRQGTHSTKTISEVSGTGRKPWPQKGTGRARHGTLRGPQFRGGCVMHGPKPRSHAIKLQKKVRRLGLKIALTARAAEGKLLIFEDLEVPTHKTKYIVDSVKQMEDAKKVLLVDGSPINETLKLATKNLYYVNVLPLIGLNVYSILQHDILVMTRDAVNKIVERMHTPVNR